MESHSSSLTCRAGRPLTPALAQLDTFHGLVDGVIVETDSAMVIRYADASPGIAASGLIVPSRLIGEPVWRLFGVNPQTSVHWGERVAHLKANRSFRNFDFSLISRGHGARHYCANGEARQNNGVFDGYTIFVSDVTDAEEAAQAHKRINTLLGAVTENCPALIVLKDVDGRFISVNRRAAEIYGISEAAASGHMPTELLSAENAAMCARLDEEVLDHESSCEVEQTFEFQGDTHTFLTQKFPLHDEGGCLIGVGAVGIDVSDLKTAADRLYYQANYDGLTDLPNRALALDRIDHGVVSAKRHNAILGVAVVDLDDFKAVNDGLGRAAGDQLLLESAQRLRQTVRESDTVARLSDDEFCLVLTDLMHDDDVSIVAGKVLEAFSRPFVVDGQEIHCTPSLGFAVYPGDAETSEKLMQFADLALHRARRIGRNGFKRFTSAMNEETTERRQIEIALRTALTRGEFSVAYQPLVNTQTGELVGAEALARWTHPTLGVISPDRFIPIAEDMGLIDDIGNWVLRTSCQHAARWRADLGQALSVAVNVSTLQLKDPAFVARVETTLEQAGLSPELLKLEITESALADNVGEMTFLLERLRALGIRLCLDDFGTGYSALSYLKSYPFDILKIDRAFVRDVTNDKLSAALADSIIRMAHRLGIQVVAEGVEDEKQLHFLRKRGCDLIQGYYFSRPLAFEDFRDYAASMRAHQAA